MADDWQGEQCSTCGDPIMDYHGYWVHVSGYGGTKDHAARYDNQEGE